MTEYEYIYQPEISFFDAAEPPSAATRRARCDLKNPYNPFSLFVGNEHAARRLCRAAFQAFGRCNHECGDHSYALLGPPSTGKTTLVRMFRLLIGLPLIEIDSHSVRSLNDIAVAISKVLENTKIKNDQYPTLELQDLGNGEIMVPPCIVFLNNVDGLTKKVENGLRRAVAGTMITNGFTFDTTAICWIVASSEHVLPDAFAHFTTIRLKPLGIEEVAQVVSLHKPDFPVEVCRLVARHASTPREALAFTKEMLVEFEMNGGDWQAVAAAVAKDHGLMASVPWMNRLGNGRN